VIDNHVLTLSVLQALGVDIPHTLCIAMVTENVQGFTQ